MAPACTTGDDRQAHLTPDSAKPDRAPSGTLSGSLPEAQRNRLVATISTQQHTATACGQPPATLRPNILDTREGHPAWL